MTGAERIKRMLLKDKLDLGEGYMRVGYYMTPCGECEVVITPTADGFAIGIKATAARLKHIEAI